MAVTKYLKETTQRGRIYFGSRFLRAQSMLICLCPGLFACDEAEHVSKSLRHWLAMEDRKQRVIRRCQGQESQGPAPSDLLPPAVSYLLKFLEHSKIAPSAGTSHSKLEPSFGKSNTVKHAQLMGNRERQPTPLSEGKETRH
jgi:hypothetical protein